MTVSAPTQNAMSHAKFVPGFHYVTGMLTICIVGVSLYRLATLRTFDAVLGALVGMVLLLQFIYLRSFPLAVQDRVIRLEERLRLRALLPAELQSRVDEFTTNQLIGMRFASDSELPALAKRVLSEKISDRSAIKQMVTNWRADHQRA